MNYGDKFTLADYLLLLEQVVPDLLLSECVEMLDRALALHVFELWGIDEAGQWVYRFVPPDERPVKYRNVVTIQLPLN